MTGQPPGTVDIVTDRPAWATWVAGSWRSRWMCSLASRFHGGQLLRNFPERVRRLGFARTGTELAFCRLIDSCERSLRAPTLETFLGAHRNARPGGRPVTAPRDGPESARTDQNRCGRAESARTKRIGAHERDRRGRAGSARFPNDRAERTRFADPPPARFADPLPARPADRPARPGPAWRISPLWTLRSRGRVRGLSSVDTRSPPGGRATGMTDRRSGRGSLPASRCRRAALVGQPARDSNYAEMAGPASAM